MTCMSFSTVRDFIGKLHVTKRRFGGVLATLALIGFLIVCVCVCVYKTPLTQH